MGEFIASYSEPMSNEDLIDIQEAPLEAKNYDLQNPPTKTFTGNEMKEAFGYPEQFLSIMEECPNEKSSQVCSAVDRDTACYRLLYQEEKKAYVLPSFDHFFKKVDKMLLASTSSQH
jgi:hypothetical protein